MNEPQTYDELTPEELKGLRAVAVRRLIEAQDTAEIERVKIREMNRILAVSGVPAIPVLPVRRVA